MGATGKPSHVHSGARLQRCLQVRRRKSRHAGWDREGLAVVTRLQQRQWERMCVGGGGGCEPMVSFAAEGKRLKDSL